MASLPSSRFGKRPVNPTSPVAKKPHTNIKTIIFTGEEYEHQKGELAGSKTGNVGGFLDFHKSLNTIIANAVKDIDLLDEYKWNHKRGHFGIKINPGAQLDKLIQTLERVAQAGMPEKMQ